MFGYEYGHSGVDGNGLEFISFMTEPPTLDDQGLLNGPGIMIMIDNKRQVTTVLRCRWAGGAPAAICHLETLKDEVLGDVEIPSLMARLGIKVKEAVDGETD